MRWSNISYQQASLSPLPKSNDNALHIDINISFGILLAITRIFSVCIVCLQYESQLTTSQLI